MIFSLFQSLTLLEEELKDKTELSQKTEDASAEGCDGDEASDSDPDPKPVDNDDYLCLAFAFNSDKYSCLFKSFYSSAKFYSYQIEDKATPPPKSLLVV